MTRAFLVLWLMLIGCSAPPNQPAEPVWGKQACAHCMMLLSEPRPAAQLVLNDGARRFFDDVGCMVEWLADNDGQAARAWVHSPDGKGWKDAFSAHYADGQRTPMDYGFLPAGDGLSFAELKRAVHQKSAHRAVQP